MRSTSLLGSRALGFNTRGLKRYRKCKRWLTARNRWESLCLLFSCHSYAVAFLHELLVWRLINARVVSVWRLDWLTGAGSSGLTDGNCCLCLYWLVFLFACLFCFVCCCLFVFAMCFGFGLVSVIGIACSGSGASVCFLYPRRCLWWQWGVTCLPLMVFVWLLRYSQSSWCLTS